MTTYVRGIVESISPGSDAHVRWLTLCHANGLLLRGIFDPQRLTAGLAPGSACEFALELTYPPQLEPTRTVAWQAAIDDLSWPRPAVGIARAPLPKPEKRRDRSGHYRTISEPTGPTCVLLHTPFGHMLTTMSHLPYFGVVPQRDRLINVSPQQRLLVLAVL